MNKKQIAITLGIMCLVLTCAIVIQIRTMNTANSTASQTLRDNGLRDNVLRWKEKTDNLTWQLKQAEEELERVRTEATQNDTTASAKQEELKRNNTLLGLTDVTGPGIVIELEDGKSGNSILAIEDSSDKLVHNDDLINLLNELRNAGAEAVEINGQRIINTSAITCEGNIIKINGERIGSPFTIKAIGSQALLYGQIIRAGSYLELMAEEGVNVKSVQQQDNITINKYSGTVNYKYMKKADKK